MSKKKIAPKFDRLHGNPHPVKMRYELVLSEPVRERKARNGKLVKLDPDINSTNLAMRGYYPDGASFLVAGSFRSNHYAYATPIILTPKEDSKSNVYQLIDQFIEDARGKGSIINRALLIRRLRNFQPHLYKDYFPEAAILEDYS